VQGTSGAGGTSSTGNDDQQRRRPPGRRARWRARTAAAFGLLTIAVIGYATFRLAGQIRGHAEVVPSATTGAVRVTLRPEVTPTTPTPTVTATATSSVAPITPEPVPLAPESAVAFGSQGAANGDNQQIAARVLTDPALGWLSQWYATPSFGDLKLGTGLLLDLGRSYSVSAVKVSLGSLPGAAFQIRLGERAALGSLPVVASGTADTAADALTLSMKAPVKARYVLIWFTRLPPDGAGHYQAWIHQVTVRGLPVR
jgi:hypothetical protein